jgi:hypothetical protein
MINKHHHRFVEFQTEIINRLHHRRLLANCYSHCRLNFPLQRRRLHLPHPLLPPHLARFLPEE